MLKKILLILSIIITTPALANKDCKWEAVNIGDYNVKLTCGNDMYYCTYVDFFGEVMLNCSGQK